MTAGERKKEAVATRGIVSIAQDMASGATAGIVTKTASAPIERVKLLLQTQHTSDQILQKDRYKGLVDCFTRIYREQGVLSFWRGNTLNVTRYIPTQALNFGLRNYLMDIATKGVNKSDTKQFLPRSMAAGGATGGISLMLLYPWDFARTRVGVDISSGSNRKFRGGIDCIRQTIKSDGFLGIYKGFDAAVVGVITWRALYFGLYEAATAKFFGGRGKGGILQRYFLANGVTLTAGTLVYPIDSVRRRMMLQAGRLGGQMYKSSSDCFRCILRDEGFRGFYRGLPANMLRSFPGALMLILVDEISGNLVSFSREESGLNYLGTSGIRERNKP